MVEWKCRSTILGMITRLRWVVSLTPLPLYPWDNRHWYSFVRRLGGLQSRSWRCGAYLAGNQTKAVQPVACRYRDWANPAQSESKPSYPLFVTFLWLSSVYSLLLSNYLHSSSHLIRRYATSATEAPLNKLRINQCDGIVNFRGEATVQRHNIGFGNVTWEMSEK
jgi:hypothetical protein